jgi:hypothetical protein
MHFFWGKNSFTEAYQGQQKNDMFDEFFLGFISFSSL